jgi:endonuclease YncB( thermonuclease family)
MITEVTTQTNNSMSELESMTKQNTEFMTLKGNIYNAKIVYIYDGDTLHVVFKEFDKFYRWNCRIMGVDTPELRTKNLKEKELGYKVRDALIERFMDKIVKIKCDEFDKYGRLLIDVFVPNDIEENDGNLMLSQWLINNEYAYEYDGGTKKSWDNL